MLGLRISRKTGHKYVARWRAEGRSGLQDRSRRPKVSPGATAEGVERLVLLEKRKHPTWGPKKIRVLLRTIHGLEDLPHVNTEDSRTGQT
ncbi:MAG: helix-turn-helix domain-containing protein [Opitutales bacterium]